MRTTTLKTENTLGNRKVVTGGDRERITNSGDEEQTTAASQDTRADKVDRAQTPSWRRRDESLGSGEGGGGVEDGFQIRDKSACVQTEEEMSRIKERGWGRKDVARRRPAPGPQRQPSGPLLGCRTLCHVMYEQLAHIRPRRVHSRCGILSAEGARTFTRSSAQERTDYILLILWKDR